MVIWEPHHFPVDDGRTERLFGEHRRGDELRLHGQGTWVWERHQFIEDESAAKEIESWGKRNDWLFWINATPTFAPACFTDAFRYRPFIFHTAWKFRTDIIFKSGFSKWFEKPKAIEQDVYFIRAGSNGPIKIGIAQDTVHRMSKLQCGCAWPLKVIGKIEGGGRSLETRLHKQFASIRMSGEWFEPRREIIEYIEANASR